MNTLPPVASCSRSSPQRLRRALKFLRVICPPTDIELELHWQPRPTRLRFAYHAPDGGTFSHGTLCFE